MLYALLAISIVTNVILLGRAAHIDWHRFVHRDQAVPAVTERDHIRGNAAGSVTVIEYSDFQCPYCARFHATLKAALRSTPDLRWVYRHYPLTEIHPQAGTAAEAAECAADQNRFWEYADALFEQPDKLGDDRFAAIAGSVGLDQPQFANCLAHHERRTRVSADSETFYEGHIGGTPTSFINGKRVEGTLTGDDLQRELEQAIHN